MIKEGYWVGHLGMVLYLGILDWELDQDEALNRNFDFFCRFLYLYRLSKILMLRRINS